MPFTLSRSSFTVLHIVTTVLLTLAVAVIAWHIKISYDESLSYYVLKTNDIKRMLGLANTHWLNSFFMKLSMLIVGDNVFGFRIASIIAFPLYATGLFKLSLLLKNHWLAFACYALLIFNPYTIQFFSLARGYGMALAFQAWLLYYLIIVFKNEKPIQAWYKICFLCALMLLANLTYLYTVFGVFGLFLLQIITRQKDYEWNVNAQKITALFALIIAGAGTSLMICRYAGDLWFGGEYFIESLFSSFWHRYAYYYNDIKALTPFLNVILLILIGISIGYFTYNFWKKRRFTAGTILTLIVLTIFGLNIFFHHAFGTPYLFKRTALQWWTPVIAMVFFCIEKISQSNFENSANTNRRQIFQPFFSITFGLLVLIHFAYQYNANYRDRIEKQRYDIQIYNDLYNKKAKHVGMSRHFCVPLKNYYQFIDSRYRQLSFDFIYETKLADCTNEKAWNKIASYDYLVISEPQTITCMKQRNINFEVVKTYGKYQMIHFVDK